MRLAQVIGNLVTTAKHPAYHARKLLLVRPMGGAQSNERVTMAVDTVGAGSGDYVLISAAPGLAKVVFHIDAAPINDMVMGIVDRVALEEGEYSGNGKENHRFDKCSVVNWETTT